DPGTYTIPSLAASTLTVNQPNTTPGATLTYTLTLRNTGGAAVTAGSASVPIPTNTSFVSGSLSGAGATISGTQVSWSAASANLAASATETITFQVTVDPALPIGSTISTSASLTNGAG